MYTYNDIFFSPQGYIWVGMWYTLCVVDSVIMKHVADTVPMTTWSRTYYNVSIPSKPAACPACACFTVNADCSVAHLRLLSDVHIRMTS